MSADLRQGLRVSRKTLLFEQNNEKLDAFVGRKVLPPLPEARKFYKSTWLNRYILAASLNTYGDADDDIILNINPSRFF